MSIMSETISILETLSLPIETGHFSGVPEDEYLVMTPINDNLSNFSDDKPQNMIEEVRISLFSKKNYLNRRKQIINLLLAEGFVLSDCRYIGYEEDTKYHHYAIDVMKEYEMEE